MNLIICSHLLPPHLGGVEQYTAAFAKEAARQGHLVSVITTTSDASPIPDVEIRTVRAIPLLKGRFPVIADPWSFSRATEVFRRRTPGLAIVQTRFYPGSLLFALAARTSGWKTVIIEHSSQHLPFPGAQRIADGYEHAISYLLRGTGARFLGVSRAAASWLAHFGIVADGLAPNAIDDNLFCIQPPTKRSAVVLYAGRLIAEKGVDTLMDAFHLFIQKHSDWQLRIAGDGPLKNKITGANVHYLGSLSRDQVLAEMLSCGMFVYPSRYPEGLPTVLLEAGAAAVPVLATPRGGTPELIRDGETGTLVGATTAGSLAQAMSRT